MNKIDSLTICSSAVCNLNCSFCFLHQNSSYAKYNKLVQEAWKDGSYLSNVEKIFNKLCLNRDDIHHLQIWGGESLLAIDNVIDNIPNLFELFPNIERWTFSTNFTIGIDKLINLINNIDKNGNSLQLFVLQLSIDGPEGKYSEKGHNGWKYYEDNIIKFTDYFNNHKLYKTKIIINVHSTLSPEDYLNNFIQYEEIKDYMQKMLNFSKFIESKCISGSLNLYQDFIFPGIATPYTHTSEDGRKLAHIFQLWDEVYKTEFKENHETLGFFIGNGSFQRDAQVLMGNTQCSELFTGLMINFDGTICECNGSFISSFEPYLEELKKNNQEDLLNTAIIHNKMTTYKPLECSEKELEKNKYRLHEGGYRGTKTTYIHCLMVTAIELAKSGQILKKYLYDEDLLFKHCKILSNVLACSRNNIIETGLPYLTPVGAIRLYFNGAMDYIYPLGIEEKKNSIRNQESKND